MITLHVGLAQLIIYQTDSELLPERVYKSTLYSNYKLDNKDKLAMRVLEYIDCGLIHQDYKNYFLEYCAALIKKTYPQYKVLVYPDLESGPESYEVTLCSHL